MIEFYNHIKIYLYHFRVNYPLVSKTMVMYIIINILIIYTDNSPTPLRKDQDQKVVQNNTYL